MLDISVVKAIPMFAVSLIHNSLIELDTFFIF
jgi:hypothetical protein